MQPWQLLNSASSFLTVVGSFNVFLGPFMGIMFADYFLLRKRTMKLTDLYEESPKSIYWYSKGWNWRAAIAWVLSVWFLIPGLVQRGIDTDAFWPGWTRLYQLAWFLGALVGGGTYLILERIWPVTNKLSVDDADCFGTFSEIEIIQGVEDGCVNIAFDKLALPKETQKVARYDMMDV
jgi:NCS1 family nucleobase:cation symporter-1